MDFSKASRFSAEAATVSDCYSYLDCDVIIIDRYIPSRLEAGGVCLAQDELPGGGTVIYFEKDYYGTLALHIPDDPSFTVSVFINGDEYSYAVASGSNSPRYALVAGPFEPGCRVKLEIKGSIRKEEVKAAEPAPEDLSEPAPEAVEAQVPDEPSESAPEAAESQVPDKPSESAPEAAESQVPDEPSESAPEAAESVPDEPSDPAPETAAEPLPEEPAKPAPEPLYDPALDIRLIKSDNARILYSNIRSRYLVELTSPAESTVLALPAGYEFEVEGVSRGNMAVFTLAPDLFTNYSIRIYKPGRTCFRDYDLVLMRMTGADSGCEVHAYTSVTGAFSGEACYVLDRTGELTETGTHGTLPDTELTIDPVSGYKWGRLDETSYYFELENGGYEISASFTAEGARMIANPGLPTEKVIVRSTTADVQRYGCRVTDGQLILKICEGEERTDFRTLVIRAIDTIAVESGYEVIFELPVQDDPEQTSEPAASGRAAASVSGHAPDAVVQTGTVKAAPKASAAKTSNVKASDRSAKSKPVSAADLKAARHITSTLAKKKNKEATKTIGIAAGALAVAGAIFALLGKDD